MTLTNAQLVRMLLIPQWPKSEYKASAPVVQRNTAPKIKNHSGLLVSKRMACKGLKACRIGI